MRGWVLVLFLVLPGSAAIVVCTDYLLGDWAKLISAFAGVELAARHGADLRALQLAEYRDLVFRINSFADGVGVMLGAILLGLGIHGLCLLPARATGSNQNQP
jgi:hypothetical protein